MPFVTSTTEYSCIWEAKKAAAKGRFHCALEELLREMSEDNRRALRHWVKSRVPSHEFRLQSHPETLIRYGYEDFINERDKYALEHFKEDCPLGRAFGPILFGLGEEKLKLFRDGFSLPLFNYQTLIGQVAIRGNDFLSLLLQEVKDFDALREVYWLSSLFEVTKNCWLPNSIRPDQIEASEYSEACQKLQATKAGRKAKRLLLENLTDEQERDYFRLGYFFVTILPGDLDLHQQSRQYVIERGFPNGNIMSVVRLMATDHRQYLFPLKTYCFHAEEPHPIDDILLSQKLFIEHYEEEFLEMANITKPHHPNSTMEHNLRTY